MDLLSQVNIITMKLHSPQHSRRKALLAPCQSYHPAWDDRKIHYIRSHPIPPAPFSCLQSLKRLSRITGAFLNEELEEDAEEEQI